MAMRIHDPELQRRILRRRRATGLDRHDEVWDGVYVVSPLPNIVHQLIVTRLTTALGAVLADDPGHLVFAGVNVSDRAEGWRKNYRCPDVAVFLAGTSARPMDTHWVGGPDFAVEVVSPGDRSRRKLAFYAAVGVRELLVVDRDPWALELYRLAAGRLDLAASVTPDRPGPIASAVVPLAFGLVEGPERPMVEVIQAGGLGRWLA